ncbi:MAG: phenylalanine--tRNA ligase subunit beta, partial [Bacteroidota bacterium]
MVENVEIKESPDWLKNRLKAIGVRPISNIVDITNYVLHETGQPLHAYDADKITGNKIIVDTLKDGSTFLSLDEVERKLSDQDLMICDGERNGMCIAGVFGGAKSGVTDSTKRIYLESAHFNAGWIRRTSFRHLLRSDAAMHFEKGVDPNNTLYALKRAALLMVELGGGKIASKVTDIYPNKIEKAAIPVAYANINRLIGVDIPKEKVHAILAAMFIDITEYSEDSFVAHIPTNKPDVTRECDVIEEILRIYGFNNVPMPSKIHSNLSFSSHPDKSLIRNRVSEYLSANGCNEMMAMSLVHSKYYDSILKRDAGELIYINNTSNISLNIMRPDMIVSALEAVQHNQNRQSSDLKLYEFGHSYLYSNPEAKEMIEKEHLTITLTGNRFQESWERAKRSTSFYSLKAFVENV